MFVHELIRRGQKNDLAIIDNGRRISYAQLGQYTEGWRRYLYGQGIRQGSHVALLSRNCAAYIYAYMAITSLGAVAVPINFQLSLRETAFILKDGNISHLICKEPLDLEAALQAQGYTGSLKQHIISAEHLPADFPALPEISFPDTEACTIIYTSGTTGTPKGAVLSHRNLTHNAAMVERVLKVSRSDTVLCVLPMYHCFAWTCAVNNALYCGSTIVILDSFTPKETIDIIHTEKISVLYVVPSICALLTKLASPEEMASVRLVVIGGTTLPQQTAKNFTTKFGLEIAEGYGLSEAAPVVSVNPPEKIKVGSIGPTLPEVETKIIRSDGSTADPNESGELLVRGQNVMLGYWHLPEETACTIQDGWLHTSDIARRDEDGYLYIVDRLKDMIISMGENIYPREIEELVYKYPGIREAAVIGVDDKLRGQAGCCYYSVSEDCEISIPALKKYLQQNLALYKIPREFHKLPELPRTTTHKIAKKELSNLHEATRKAKKKI